MHPNHKDDSVGEAEQTAPPSSTNPDGSNSSTNSSADLPNLAEDPTLLKKAADPIGLNSTAQQTPGAPSRPGASMNPWASTPVPELQGYDSFEKIGMGGMGVVYKARHIGLNRFVAIKTIRDRQWASEAEVRRFHAEAEAAAKLSHPNIVAIHDVGVADGVHYFAMDYIAGRPLSEFVREVAVPAGDAAAIVETVAGAIQYAHENGILHRDLKPSNVLIEESGRPMVTDFGLAKKLSEDPRDASVADLTATDQILGTPGFMPPEQARAQKDRIGPASDVYSMGAVLYQLLTGRPPFQAESPIDTLKQVLESDPAPPRLLNSSIPVDIESICMKCLEREPSERYQTAMDLAEELRRFIRREPISARPISWSRRLLRWCRRNPRIAAPTAAAGLMLVILAGGAIAAAISLEHKQSQTEQARQQVIENLGLAEANFDKALEAGERLLDQMAGDQLKDIPHADPVREEILRGAVEFYSDLLDQDNEHPAARYATASAQRQLGYFYSLMGRDQEATASFELSIEGLSALHHEDPAHSAYSIGLAKTLEKAGTHWNMSENNQRAEKSFRDAVTLRERIAGESPENPDRRSELGESYRQLASTLMKRGEYDLVKTLANESVALSQSLVDNFPLNEQYLADLAGSYFLLSSLQSRTASPSDSLETVRKAVELMKQLVEISPRPIYRSQLAMTLNNLGIQLRTAKQYRAAWDAYSDAVAIRESLSVDFPHRLYHKDNLASLYNNQAVLANYFKNYEEAETLYSKSLEIRKYIVTVAPQSLARHSDLAHIYRNMGYLFTTQNRPSDAYNYYQQAAIIQEKLVEEASDNPMFRARLADTYRGLSSSSAESPQRVSYLRKSMGLYEYLIGRHPQVREYRMKLVQTYVRLAELLKETNPEESSNIRVKLRVASEELKKIINE